MKMLSADDVVRHAAGVFERVWADCRAAVANGRPAGDFPAPPRSPKHDGLENPLAAPLPARALLKDHVATLLARREELGLSHEDVAAIMWGLRRLDWAAMRHLVRRERKHKGASNLHVAEVQFPNDFEGGRTIQKWETGQRIPNAMDLVDWCTALGLDIDVTPIEGGGGEAAE